MRSIVIAVLSLTFAGASAASSGRSDAAPGEQQSPARFGIGRAATPEEIRFAFSIPSELQKLHRDQDACCLP